MNIFTAIRTFTTLNISFSFEKEWSDQSCFETIKILIIDEGSHEKTLTLSEGYDALKINDFIFVNTTYDDETLQKIRDLVETRYNMFIHDNKKMQQFYDKHYVSK